MVYMAGDNNLDGAQRIKVAAGMRVFPHPPHRSRRAKLPHRASVTRVKYK
jgi:hypothetical protein